MFLLSAAAISLRRGSPMQEDSAPLFAVIALTAIAMGLRSATMRKVGMSDLTTTVLTLTITGIAADSSLAGGSNPRWQRRIVSVLCMFAGAAAGGFLLKYSVALPLLICALGSSAAAMALVVWARTIPESRGTLTRRGDAIHRTSEMVVDRETLPL